MQTERDVHESVARGLAMVAVPTGASEIALEDGDLGDSVEFFRSCVRWTPQATALLPSERDIGG